MPNIEVPVVARGELPPRLHGRRGGGAHKWGNIHAQLEHLVETQETDWVAMRVPRKELRRAQAAVRQFARKNDYRFNFDTRTDKTFYKDNEHAVLWIHLRKEER